MRVRAVAVLAASLLLTSCSSAEEPPPPPGQQPAPTTTSSAPLFDPPRGFTGESKLVGRSPYAIAGDAVVSRDPEREQPTMTVIGLDGTPRVEYPVDIPKKSKASGPYSAADGSLVLMAVAQTVEGTGTNPDRTRYTVTAHNPGTGAKVWERPVDASAEVPLPDSNPRIVGANRDIVVVTANLLKEAATIALSTVDGTVKWSKPGIFATGLANDVVVGYRYVNSLSSEPVGLSATDGAQRWSGPRFDGTLESNFSRPRLVGDGLASFAGTPAGELTKNVTHLLDTTTGKPRLSLDSLWTCLSDDQSLIVCGKTYFNYQLAGFDATSMAKLWELPDAAATRTIPKLVAARKGVAYVTAKGPMTLNARSGKDLDPELDVDALDAVAPGYALGVVSGKVYARRAAR
ncbi:outer membrane protein assembly factor BamB family protein [Allokutzneria albata]|uniref:PQQ-like domain-containing protein n=1 Tax=Allokutzneria albata TaxID=211114 RepID=A0A1G9X1A6_ALLAB|nr:PQQ-binding-like beta-propeller repeat protein [Allokutzneria albata]SDM90193.1 PQQ-like domain-containing protein [Allokutzneria albata]